MRVWKRVVSHTVCLAWVPHLPACSTPCFQAWLKSSISKVGNANQWVLVLKHAGLRPRRHPGGYHKRSPLAARMNEKCRKKKPCAGSRWEPRLGSQRREQGTGWSCPSAFFLGWEIWCWSLDVTWEFFAWSAAKFFCLRLGLVSKQSSVLNLQARLWQNDITYSKSLVRLFSKGSFVSERQGNAHSPFLQQLYSHDIDDDARARHADVLWFNPQHLQLKGSQMESAVKQFGLRQTASLSIRHWEQVLLCRYPITFSYNLSPKAGMCVCIASMLRHLLQALVLIMETNSWSKAHSGKKEEARQEGMVRWLHHRPKGTKYKQNKKPWHI